MDIRDAKGDLYLDLNSHIILVNYIADILEELIDVKIDRDMLELGAVYPDMNIRKRVRIHNKKQVYNNYYLQTENIINKNKNKWGISFSLGMLSHYVCDCFCLAHNKKMRSIRDFKEHVRYEKKLARVVKDYDFDSSIIARVQESLYRSLDFDIMTFLEEYQDTYLTKAKINSEDEQIAMDIENSIFCSCITTLGFIYELERAESPAVQVLHI